MWEDTLQGRYQIACDKDHLNQPICAIRDTRTRQIVATGAEGRLAYHVPTTDQLKQEVEAAAIPWRRRLAYKG